jgi:hypothetical protein
LILSLDHIASRRGRRTNAAGMRHFWRIFDLPHPSRSRPPPDGDRINPDCRPPTHCQISGSCCPLHESRCRNGTSSCALDGVDLHHFCAIQPGYTTFSDRTNCHSDPSEIIGDRPPT